MDSILLQNKIGQAKVVENTEDFFRASFLYKDALSLAIKLNNSKQIGLCKNKVVEMNKKMLEEKKPPL